MHLNQKLMQHYIKSSWRFQMFCILCKTDLHIITEIDRSLGKPLYAGWIIDASRSVHIGPQLISLLLI